MVGPERGEKAPRDSKEGERQIGEEGLKIGLKHLGKKEKTRSALSKKKPQKAVKKKIEISFSSFRKEDENQKETKQGYGKNWAKRGAVSSIREEKNRMSLVYFTEEQVRAIHRQEKGICISLKKLETNLERKEGRPRPVWPGRNSLKRMSDLSTSRGRGAKAVEGKGVEGSLKRK